MPPNNNADRISETQRREIFLALVEAQDQHASVQQSRKMIAGQYGITEKEVRAIEEEGLNQEWPPLSE